MKSRACSVTLVAMLASLMFLEVFGQVSTTTGQISKVTVYRGQALVTRTVDANLPVGTSEIIVTDLPKTIIPESLYAQTADNIKVLSVRYREKTIKKGASEELKQLKDQIQEVKDQIFRTDQDRQHAQLLWEHYQPFWKLTIDGAKLDLNRGLLQSEPIENLTTHLESKWVLWHDKKVELELEKNTLQEELERLQRKHKKLSAGRSRTVREAVLFIHNKEEDKATVQLSYLVRGANWVPQYNLRADLDKSNVLIEYNAVVNQSTTEDWNNVALSLSTAEPTMVAAAPILEPLEIILATGVPSEVGILLFREGSRSADAKTPADAQQVEYRDLSSQFSAIQRKRRSESRKGKAANDELNYLALNQQMIEFQADSKTAKMLKKQARKFARTEGIGVSYDLPGKLSLPTRTAQHLVTIATIRAESQFTLVAAPLLTDYVYREAELVNTSNTILLPGRASMYCNGDFVGNDQLKLVTIGEKFTSGFGVDSQVQISREFKDKKSDTLWGNRVETYDYRIAINNYKDTAVKLRLMDRLPYTEDESIGISDFKTNTSLSNDAEYQRTLKEKGILQWDLNLKPNTVEQDATIVTYGFTMKYDNEMHIQPVKSGG